MFKGKVRKVCHTRIQSNHLPKNIKEILYIMTWPDKKFSRVPGVPPNSLPSNVKTDLTLYVQS